MSEKPKNYRWDFFKAGGVYQVKIRNGEDIANIGLLDQKLWAALSCPTRGLFFDEKTLDSIDLDGDSRIRHNELVAAVNWICGLLKDKSALVKSPDALKLANINEASEEGAALVKSARKVLANLGKGDAAEISVADFADTSLIFSKVPFNGDGVITEESTADAALKTLIAEMVSVYGGKPDLAGIQGVDAEIVGKFFDSAAAYVAWGKQPETDKAILFAGEGSADAYAAYLAVREKIDDYFTRSRILAFDPSADAAVNPDGARFSAILGKDVSSSSEDLKQLPVSRIEQSKPLALDDRMNPAWADAMADFAQKTAKPTVGDKSEITREDWLKIKTAVAPYQTWISAKPADGIEKLSLERAAEILGGNAKAELADLLEKDIAVKPETDNIFKVEKLVRLNKNIFELVSNFVCFQRFYQEGQGAIFQYGRLFIDKRACDLCIKVEDVDKHAKMAPLSYGYLLYCVCKRKDMADMNIVAVVSSGDSGNLMVGRNGVFYDRLGRDWDASVTKIVENPIGIGQAFLSPYKRFGKMISEQIEKFASNADTSVVNKVSSTATDAVANPAGSKKIDVGTVAALGVAVAGITAALGVFLDFFKSLGPWMPLGVLGIILLISLPSMFIAAMKLRTRNLAPLLDANGWAVNSKSNVNIMFGSHLTQVAKLPKGAHRDMADPYVKKHSGTKIFAAIAVAVLVAVGALWYCGKLERIGMPAPSWSYVEKRKAAEAAEAAAKKAEQDAALAAQQAEQAAADAAKAEAAAAVPASETPAPAPEAK